jgi:hypothetical protein
MEALKQIMAKRARGTTTRPGQRRPMQRQAARPAARPVAPAEPIAPRPATLTDEEEARAAQLEAAIVAQEQAAAETARRARPSRLSADAPTRSVSSLAVAAGNEYAYVARDVRRIALVGGTLVGVLAALWIAVQVTGVTL